MKYTKIDIKDLKNGDKLVPTYLTKQSCSNKFLDKNIEVQFLTSTGYGSEVYVRLIRGRIRSIYYSKDINKGQSFTVNLKHFTFKNSNNYDIF